MSNSGDDDPLVPTSPPISDMARATRRSAQRIRALLLSHRDAIAALPGPEADLTAGGLRWTRYRKLVLVKALAANLMSVEDALARFKLSSDELEAWIVHIGGAGVDGLRAISARPRP